MNAKVLVSGLLLGLVSCVCTSDAVAQSGHHGNLPPGAASSPFTHRHPGGSGAVFRSSGAPLMGPPGLVQQLGGGSISSATYYSGNTGLGPMGVARYRNSGVYHFSNGAFFPSIMPYGGLNSFTSMYGYNYGYGYGFNPVYGAVPNGLGYQMSYPGMTTIPGWNGPMTPVMPGPGALTVDPWTGMLIPYSCYSNAVPYFGGFNAYSTGFVAAPTWINLQVTLQPTVPSTAAYTMTDPRILDFIAPMAAQPAPDAIANVPPAPKPDRALPLLNEFAAAVKPEKEPDLTDKIHSLRHQSIGDDAFRKEDYAQARDEYEQAMKMAPERRAPWIRLSVVSIALADFPNAAAYLKTGLEQSDDATRAWVTAEELYGEKVGERTRTHASRLWNWLSEQPMSSDRLLLAGTYQKVRGFGSIADDLLKMASHEGPEADRVLLVQELAASDTGSRFVAQELDVLRSSNAADNKAADGTASDAGVQAPVDPAPLIIPPAEAPREEGGIYLPKKSPK
ncbi:MAG: tetratricopeptide repeat protein [Planctomycetaceae bacterium]|nr:tetratricopeptide repeat protein [Planctomycetaceae bacterium]